jgi:hypothetical protein
LREGLLIHSEIPVGRRAWKEGAITAQGILRHLATMYERIQPQEGGGEGEALSWHKQRKLKRAEEGKNTVLVACGKFPK